MKAHPDSIRNAYLLESLYIGQKLSSREIACQLGVNDRLVRAWLYKFGIPTRSIAQANLLSGPKRRKRVPGICSICGKELTVIPYRYKRYKQFYCSRECQIKDSARSLGMAKEIRLKTHPRIEKICPICHTVFTVPFSHSRRKYCSDQCKGAAQMMACGANKTPSQPELRIIEILSKHFPEFKYNGNGQLGVILGGMIPDFLNVDGKKQVIEVFGDYYHGTICRNWRNSELGKKMAYNSLGYKCLVLWQSEIENKTNEELVNTIRKFSKGK